MTTENRADDEVVTCLTALRVTIRTAAVTFSHTSDTSRDLSDLRPRFWMALGRLLMAVECRLPAVSLFQEVKQSHAVLGAPGDFGYGTPCGDALRAVYEAARELGHALKRAEML